MDPVAARQSGPPDVLMPVEAAGDVADGATAEDASMDPARADATEDEREPVPVAAGSSTETNSAVRLLRTIAPWTAPSDFVRRHGVDDAVEPQGPDQSI